MMFEAKQFIGIHDRSAEGTGRYTAVAAATGAPIEPEFPVATPDEVDRAARLAEEAAESYADFSPRERETFLLKIAELLMNNDDVLKRAHEETGLPMARLEGERARTANQLRLQAAVAVEGRIFDARIETALPDRKPLPRPDLRRVRRPIGPVAVFGASNFPLAFSVAGGDTASALAAGCPVVVKAHPAHPGTCDLVAQIVSVAARTINMPPGTFHLLHGHAEVGQALVSHPAIKAVGFTGSHAAGRALMDIAARRPHPIPVFAEMGSVNPVVMLSGALKSGGTALAESYIGSLTLGAGQFCTNPGLVIGVQGAEWDAFIKASSDAFAKVPKSPMLTPGIQSALAEGLANAKRQLGVKVRYEGEGEALLEVSAENFLTEEALREEIFGPVGIAVTCASADELFTVLQVLDGQLTASIHATKDDFELAHRLVKLATQFAGRIVMNGFPTGVEVGQAMQHGGPYPASSDARFTSVGGAAMERWLTAVSYQDVDPALLPPSLQPANPWGIPRQEWGS